VSEGRSKGYVLIIEDEAGSREAMERALRKMGFEVDAFGEGELALAHLADRPDCALVVTDLMMPGMDGMTVLRRARETVPDVGVLMVTGHASVDSAVEAMKRGAEDYLNKPVELTELRRRVENIVEKVRLAREVEKLRRSAPRDSEFEEIVGRAPSMLRIFEQIRLVAPTRSSVLIVGESGTGKELVSRAIHRRSPRRDRTFVAINSAAIPAEILESELFGHEKGAFTGATARKMGTFELADGGTLFLDEIGELPMPMQAKLLRILEQQEFMRVGGTETIRVDVRLIAASNLDLEKAVQEGSFRQDLYYRLKVIALRLPPLRERREDIPLLASYFLRRFADEHDRPEVRLTPRAARVLISNRWEGNVRELRNVLESTIVLATGDTIDLEDLPPEYRREEPDVDLVEGAEGAEGVGQVGMTMSEIERRAILKTLEETGGNRTRAAEMLGIGLRTLQRKLKEYRSDEPERQDP
jgi:DNA-binding NtrC family response regulator